MHLRQLQYLQLVVQKGSFAGAALEAGVSQPAISLAMQALEREWGMALFEKVGRQKLPTHAALLAAQRAADLQGRLDGLVRKPQGPVEWAVGQGAAVLRAGMAPAAALLYGPTIERAWRECEAEGVLQIVAGSAPELLSALHDRELDIVVVPRPRRYQATGLRHHRMHTSTPTVFARADHPLVGATSLAEIEHAGWAVAGRAGTAGNVIEEAHRVRGLPQPRILAQCGDYPTLLNLVAHSDLLCVVPHPALLLGPQGTAVQALHIREGLPRYDVWLCWLSGKPVRNASAIDAVVGALKASVEERPSS